MKGNLRLIGDSYLTMRSRILYRELL